MTKKPMKKTMAISEAIVWGVFIFTDFIAAAALLRPNLFTEFTMHVVAYILSAYAAVALGYMLFKAVENK